MYIIKSKTSGTIIQVVNLDTLDDSEQVNITIPVLTHFPCVLSFYH